MADDRTHARFEVTVTVEVDVPLNRDERQWDDLPTEARQRARDADGETPTRDGIVAASWRVERIDG